MLGARPRLRLTVRRRTTASFAGLALLAAVVGCSRTDSSAAPPASRGSGPNGAFDLVKLDGATIAQPFADEEGDPPFRMRAVFPLQRPVDVAPWHVEGGNWTLFDAETSDGALFTFGWQEPAPSQDFAFTEAKLMVPDAAAGKCLTESLARAFHGKVPAPRSPQPIAPVRVRPLERADRQRGPRRALI